MNWKAEEKDMSKKYLKYLFESHKVAWFFFGILYFLLVMIFDGQNLMVVFPDFRPEFAFHLGIAGTYILPFFLFGFVHEKKACDQMFALPLSRKKLLVTSLVFAFLVLACYFTVTVSFIWVRWKINFISLLEVLGIYYVCISAMLCVNSFFYLLGNNLLDGVVMTISYSLFPLVLLMALSAALNQIIAGTGEIQGLNSLINYLSPFSLCESLFSNLSSHSDSFGTSLSWFLVLAGEWLCACFGLKKEFIERKTERAENISDNKLAYPLVVHVYLAVVMIGVASMVIHSSISECLPTLIVLFVVYIIAMFVYKRKIQITVKLLARFAICALACFGFIYAGFYTKGFHQAEKFSLHQGKYIVYYYDDFSRNDEPHFTLTIPVDEKKKYQEVLDLMENYRKENIDLYYQDIHDQWALNSQGLLNWKVMDSNDEMNQNQYQYNGRSINTGRPLTKEELAVIGKYTKVETVMN